MKAQKSNALLALEYVTIEVMNMFDVDRVSADEYVGLWLDNLHEEYWCTASLGPGMARKLERFLEHRLGDREKFLAKLNS